ncbi:MAG TPA: aromatic ring-hydroxylating dioxygenase subunit alpha [Pyrinomonadaceae bacterium]|nr:aromatic ring-hydroxylating dioxygenase subunit alpha [Pyrinomonadaceae bacterium]
MKTAPNSERWATRYPELGTEPLPVEPNISPEYFERERERIFKRCWLNVGRIDEIPKTGDYFIKEIETLRASVVVVRGKDGAIRGFYNVCRHRGNKLALENGHARSFVCGFHGWTYDLLGCLVRVPDEEQFVGLDKTQYGLTPVATDVWEGFIFINLDPNPAESLQEFIGELFDQFRGYPFAAMRPAVNYSAVVNVNWKVFMEIFQECYHVAYIHQRSVAEIGTGKDNPFGHLLSVRLYRRHRSASVYYNPEHRPTAAETLAFKHGPTILQGTAGKVLPRGINPEGSPKWGFEINAIFPNFILDLANGSYWTQNFWPLAVDRTSWEVKLYLNPTTNAGEKISQEFSKVLMRDAFREDLSRLENIQLNMASGALTHTPLSDQEIVVRHAYKVVEDVVGTSTRSA